MSVGAAVVMPEPVPEPQDFGEYPLKTEADGWEIAREMKRAENRGALEYVDTLPEDEQRDAVSFVHPFVVVHQRGKVRVCEDYSIKGGLNHYTSKWPFSLPRCQFLRYQSWQLGRGTPRGRSQARRRVLTVQ